MNFPKPISVSFVALILSISFVSISECSDELSITGFSTDLIHRDSPHSPSYDPSLTPSQRTINALKRSSHRARRISYHQKRSELESEPENEKPEPDVSSAQGEYMMKFSVGTPAVPSIAIVDTGSDVVWTQCKPCIECFNQSLPLFSPRNSSSYRRVSCTSPVCTSSRDTHCGGVRQNCLYSSQYGDGSSTTGMLATERFTFASTGGKTVTVPDVLFGCGFKNGGLFTGIESGIVGLGGGKASLVTQLGPLAQGKFSYCLLPFSDKSNSSKLRFGAEAVVSGEGVVSTPLFAQKGLETYYFLSLEGISVGKNRLEFYDGEDDDVSNSKVAKEGNMIIDSGTTLTMLPSTLYEKMENELAGSIKLERVSDPSGVLGLCYATRDGMPEFPQITIHFTGADLQWRYENAFVRIDDDSVCLAVRPSESFAIYGNLAQVNFLVGYDVVNKTVSFKPDVDCAND